MKSIEDKLSCYTGTEKYYRFNFGNITIGYYTDGVKAMAELCEAYWLIDVVMSYQTIKFRQKHTFQVWILTKDDDNNAIAIAEDGNGKQIKKQVIGYSTFPFDEFEEPFKMFFCNDVLHLPSEY